MSSIALCRTVNLVNAINRRDFMIAWLESCDLSRAIVEAESLVLEMTSERERRAAMTRLEVVRDVALKVLVRAPNPTPLAIAQARSSLVGLDRRTWADEEQRWINACTKAGSLWIASEGDNLSLTTFTMAQWS
ncbi:MAG: hypothetical protein ACREBE_21740 [bacterium]